MTNLHTIEPNKTEEKSDLVDHVKDLPPELLKQLSNSYKKGRNALAEDSILEIATAAIKELGPCSADDIIVMAYRNEGKILRRNAVLAHLARLAEKGAILHPNKRTYALPKSST